VKTPDTSSIDSPDRATEHIEYQNTEDKDKGAKGYDVITFGPFSLDSQVCNGESNECTPGIPREDRNWFVLSKVVGHESEATSQHGNSIPSHEGMISLEGHHAQE